MVKELRSYVFTGREREILKRFIETGEKLDGFSVLVHHLKKHRDALIRDLELIETVSKKVVPSTVEEVEDEILKQSEERRKARLRTRGPYRKAHVEKM